MKKILVLAACIWGFLIWHQHQAMLKVASGGDPVDSGTIVVSYSTNGELLQKLRKVKTGQRIDIQAIGVSTLSSTGIQNADTDKKSALLKQQGQEQDQEIRLIRAELARIEGSHE